MPKLHRKIWIVYFVTIHCMAVGQNNETNRRKTFHDINLRHKFGIKKRTDYNKTANMKNTIY